MKNVLIITLLLTSNLVIAQSNQKKDEAIVSPRFALQNLSVGKKGSDIEVGLEYVPDIRILTYFSITITFTTIHSKAVITNKKLLFIFTGTEFLQ